MKNIILPMFLIISLLGCRKEGCTDVLATNYDANAKKDNGLCEYEANLVFWYDQSVMDFLVNDGATSLYFYIDGTLEETIPLTVWWTSAPHCDENGAINVKINMGKNNTDVSRIEVYDQTGWKYYDFNAEYSGGGCTPLRLQ